MKKILSLEFEAGSWSWGVISKHLHKVLKNDYTMFPVDFTSWRNTAKTNGFDLILSQNITQIKFIPTKNKTICRLGGNRSFDDVEEFTLKRYYSYLATCAAVIATNKKLYDIAIQYNPKTFLIPNGIDLNVWNANEYKTVSPKRPFIGFIGNVSTPVKSQYKGYEHVKQACKELNLNLVEALYKTKQIPHVFMRDKFWKRIDLFVLPTAGEGASNSLMEALACVPGDSPVFLNGALYKMLDVKVGDSIHDSEVHKVFDNGVVDRLIGIKVLGLPLFHVTHNHPIKRALLSSNYDPALRKEGKLPYVRYVSGTDFVPASDIKKGEFVIYPKYKKIDTTHSVSVAPYLKKQGMNYALYRKLSADIPMSNDLAYFLGWYVAEGSACVNGNIFLDLGMHEEMLASHLSSIIEKLFPVTVVVKKNYGVNKSGIRILFSCSAISRWLRDIFGSRSYQKKIPVFIMNSDIIFVRHFLSGYVRGDGWFNKAKNKIVVSTSSETLAMQMALLFSKIDLLAVFSMKRNKEVPCSINGRDGMSKKCWNLSIVPDTDLSKKKYLQDSLNFYLPITSVVEIIGSFKIRNFSTSTGEFCVPFINTHNCGVPTITTRCAGFHGEMLHDGVNTVFCERNAKSVKDAVQRFIVDNSLYKKISVNGRKFAEEHHDINKVALKFKEVIELCAPTK